MYVSARNTSLNITKGCNNGSTAANSAYGPTLTHGGTSTSNNVWFSTTLLSGICGSLCRSYIPVFDLQGSLQIRVTFSQWYQLGKYSAQPALEANSIINIGSIEMHCNMIKLSEPVLATYGKSTRIHYIF